MVEASGVRYFIRILLLPGKRWIYFQGGKNISIKKMFSFSAKNGDYQKRKLAISNQAKTQRQGFVNGIF